MPSDVSSIIRSVINSMLFRFYIYINNLSFLLT